MELKKLKIEAVSNKPESKNVSILVKDKNGQDTWMSAWKSARTEALQKGETIYAYITPKEYNGKTYLNFTLPSMDHLLCKAISSQPVEQIAEAFGGTVKEELPPQVPQDLSSIDVDSIPF